MKEGGAMKKDISSFLSRKDKWYLGGGNKLAWTPTFPAHLDSPGFWDYLNYYSFRIEPGFTFTLLENGKSIKLRQTKRHWSPHVLICEYDSEKISAKEEKVLLEQDFLGSKVTLRNKTNSRVDLDIVVWTAQPATSEAEQNDTQFVSLDGKNVVLKKTLRKLRHEPLDMYVELALEDANSYNITFSRRTGNLPVWEYTPFYEKLTSEGLVEEILTDGIDRNGLLYVGIHRKISLDPNEMVSFNMGLAAGSSREKVKSAVRLLLKENIVELSNKHWAKYFSELPYFECSDPYLDRYYWYRWYGLKLFTIDVEEGNLHYPAIAEGPDYFRVFITYSAQCHILETRWMRNDSIARGSLMNFIRNQRDNGAFVGHIYVNTIQKNGFYHADWGRVVKELHATHPDLAFLKNIYQGLVKYVEYFKTYRDPENSGLYDVLDQFETGQEFMSRYLAVDEMADRYDWINNIRLKGVDATVYIYNLKKTLAWIADKLGEKDDKEKWLESADKTKRAVLHYMWDPEDEMFYDVNPKDFTRTKVKAAVCFYPYLTDIVDDSHIPGLKKHLLDEREFWTTYPVASTSVDDPYFDAYAQWKGKRHNCPWNGRVWPMTNSHIADVLGISARKFNDACLKEKTVEFIEKFIKMMFYDGDVDRPNCYEHYNPFNGKASVYRGVDDYQHSWVVDLYFKYIIGLIPDDDRLVIDPFPFDLNYNIENLRIKGKEISISWNGSKYLVRIDGELFYEGAERIPLTIEL